MKKTMATAIILLISMLMVSCSSETTLANPYGDDLFHQGLLPVTEDGTLWGYVNTKGELVIEENYISASFFYDCGVAIVQDENHTTLLIDTEGNVIPTDGVKTIYSFNSAGIAPFLSTEYEMGLLDSEGQIVLEARDNVIFPSLQDVFTFQGGGLLNLQGLIDIEGNVILEPTYDYIRPFSEISDLTQVTGENNLEGAINTDGEEVLEPIYENVFIDYQHDFILAKDEDGLWGLFDEEGTAIVNMESIVPILYDETNEDGKKLATGIDEDYNITLIDETGKIVSTFAAPEGTSYDQYSIHYLPFYNYGVNLFLDEDRKAIGIYDTDGKHLLIEGDILWNNDMLYAVYDNDDNQLVFRDYDQNVILEIENHISVDLDTGYPDYFTVYTINENQRTSLHIFDYDGNPIYEGSSFKYNEMYIQVNLNGYTLFNEEVDGEYLYGFLNSKFDVAIKPTFQLDEAYIGRWGFFTDGYAVLSIDGKYGVIDGEGNIVLDFIYDDIIRDGVFRIEDNWVKRISLYAL